MPKVPRIRSLHIFAISPEKHGGEVDFLPANKHKSFLQVDSITLVLHSLACRHPSHSYIPINPYFFSKILIFSYILINTSYISYILMKNLEIVLDNTLICLV